MPSNVTNYLGLTLLGLAISLVSTVFGFQEQVAALPNPNMATVIIIVDVVIFAVSLGLIAAVAWGRQNWARWVQLVFYLLGLLMLATVPFNSMAMAQMTSFKLAVVVVTTLMQGAALFFIFTGNAKAWFQRPAKN